MAVGDSVIHKIFGHGVVVGFHTGTTVVKFDRLSTVRDILTGFSGMYVCR